jgi:hypothetical protein
VRAGSASSCAGGVRQQQRVPVPITAMIAASSRYAADSRPIRTTAPTPTTIPTACAELAAAEASTALDRELVRDHRGERRRGDRDAHRRRSRRRRRQLVPWRDRSAAHGGEQDPPIAQGRRRPQRGAGAIGPATGHGPAMMPTSPPTESTMPAQTTPAIQSCPGCSCPAAAAAAAGSA